MPDPALARLEFGRILAEVSSRAFTSRGRELAESIVPAADRQTAGILRDETLHASLLIESGLEPSFTSMGSADYALQRLNDGAIALEPEELRGTGMFAREISSFRERSASLAEDVPGVLHDKASSLPDLRELSSFLLGITTADGDLSPSASPELKKHSRRIERLRSSISAKLSSICSSHAGTGVLRDSPPTLRSGRYVIPVAAARKKAVRGIVHDRSESGATLFIEPEQVVEAGNELQEALMDLEQERRRILREATDRIRQEMEAILQALETGAALDLAFARGKYHRDFRTVFPDEGSMRLVDLLHPLLSSETAVSSTVELPSEWRVLVVSGPNAGGKSVLLKAIALASVCSRAGLGTLAGDSSTMPFFKRVMVSMGDNQSIAMHLSTYSARLAEQREILAEGGSETLAIIDEPAAGTDPVTGAALAAVFLESLAESGSRAVVSTHMGQLKLLALEKTGFINGSMSFDPETLSPGYEFVPGIPGASCTLEAAAIAGFPEELLSRASELAGDSFSLDRLVVNLRELQEKKIAELEGFREERRRSSIEAGRLREKLLQTERNAEQTARNAEREIAEKLRRIESRADSLLATMASTDGGEERLNARKKLGELARSEAPEPGRQPAAGSERPSGEFNPGDTVTVEGWTGPATVEKVGRSTAMVRMGPLLVKKDLSALSPSDAPKKATVSISEYETPSESPEVLLLGMTVDEALSELDIKIDNCSAAGLKRLRVVHGKGRLMKGVTDWLRHDSRVQKVTMAAGEEGGAGASIVILRG